MFGNADGLVRHVPFQIHKVQERFCRGDDDMSYDFECKVPSRSRRRKMT